MASVAGYASAQSSATVYGIADTMYTKGNGSLTSKSGLGSGGNMTSRFGFKGIEDLGGGMKAGFDLEAQMFVDSGDGQPTNVNNQANGTSSTSTGFTFARRSTVSLHGSIGELRVGRDFTAHYRNRVEVDPFGNASIGAIQPFSGSIGGPISTRASNMIGYFLPTNSNGIYGQVQYYLGENPTGTAQSNDGNGLTARIGYNSGPLNISFATATTKYAVTATSGNIESTNLAAQYQIGNFRLMTGIYHDVVKRTAPLTADGWTFGGILKVGGDDLKMAVSKYGTDAKGDPSAKKISLGYVKNLTKRTALYTTWARVANSGGSVTALGGSTTAANASSNGYDFGIRHQF
jgi:predicted porin